jgi:hypothetical protein
MTRREIKRTPTIEKAHRLQKRAVVLGFLFAASFFWVRILGYGYWYTSVLPQFYLRAKLSVCTNDVLEGLLWCMRLNALAVVLLTLYFALNIYWFVCIVKKIIYS